MEVLKIKIYLGKIIIDCFWEKVSKKEDCWEWIGNISRGYGFIWINKRNILVYRFLYWFYKGDFLEGRGWYGICVCYKCDNRKCVNLDYLWFGMYVDNMKDVRNKGKFVK